MRAAVIVASFLLVSEVAHAGDSVWMTCEGVAKGKGYKQMHLVANVLEHRGADGDSRVADVAILHGSNLATGAFKTDDETRSAVTLSLPSDSHTRVFTGDATLNLMRDNRSFAIKGKLDLNFGVGSAQQVAIDVTFRCHELDDDAIGK